MKQATRTRVRDFVAAAALGVAVAAMVVLLRQPQVAANASSESMLRGTQYLSVLRARLQDPALSRSAATIHSEALQALYIARVQLGLGSPFRAIEAALRDPLLPDSVRPHIASAMLVAAMTIAPTAAGPLAIDPGHAAIVDSVVRSHPEPRRGEEIVRIGFGLAAASGAISQSEATTASDLAAVARDAAYTQRDAARLIAAAHRGGLTPLALLPLWRQERRFDVEQPIVYPIDWASSGALVSSAERLYNLLDGLASVSEPAKWDGPAVSPVIREAARRVARGRAAPPSPSIVQIGGALPASRLSPPATEEELAAAWLAMSTLAEAERRAWARVFATAAVRLRPTAQDPVWFAGDAGPSVSALQQRHGLRSVTFAEKVPTAWRGYALSSIDHALLDARRVFPGLDVRGLRIHVGMKADWPARALALHDPVSRTIYFPLGTAPGVLAHELGHDLDWQVARSVFGERGIYATDGTARRVAAAGAARRAEDILADPVQRLTGGSPLSGARGAMGKATAMRPTEVLARHVDWIVAAALATQGRSNGFLSTVQESGDALGNSSPPRLEQIDAALSVLATATSVPSEALGDIQARRREPLVRDVLARALAANVRMPWNRRSSPLSTLSEAAFAVRQAADPRDGVFCGVSASVGGPDWTADVVALVADARSRHVLRRLSETASRRAPTRSGWTLLRTAMHAGPVDPDVRERSQSQLRREIEWQLTTAMLPPIAQASRAGGPLQCG